MRGHFAVECQAGFHVQQVLVHQAHGQIRVLCFERGHDGHMLVGGVLGLSELGAIRMSPLGRDISAIVRAYRREVVA